MTGLVGLAVAAGVMLVAAGFGVWRRRRDGTVRVPASAPEPDRPQAPSPGRSGPPAGPPEPEPWLLGIGFTPDTARVTLVQFSSAFCAPCRATRVICGQLASQLDGVRHLEVDAESHLEAVRAAGVWRTPTVFIVDRAGQVVGRVTGAPTRTQLTEAITPLLAQQVRS